MDCSDRRCQILAVSHDRAKNRGVQDILVACVDGLKGFPDAIASVYPHTDIQLCIVHFVRNSLRFVSWKDYKAVTSGLKAIYQASTEENALKSLDIFCDQWNHQYPKIGESWGPIGKISERSLAIQPKYVMQFIQQMRLSR